MSNEREKDVRGENGGECSRIWVVHSPIDFSLTLEEGCFVGYFHAAETGKDFCRFECYLWRFYLIEHGFIRASISLWEGWYNLIIWHLKTALLHLVIMAPIYCYMAEFCCILYSGGLLDGCFCFSQSMAFSHLHFLITFSYFRFLFACDFFAFVFSFEFSVVYLLSFHLLLSFVACLRWNVDSVVKSLVVE